MRYELFNAARKSGAAFMQLYAPCSRVQALARNQQRSGVAVVPLDALLRMAGTLEPPQPARFPWEATSLAYEPHVLYNLFFRYFLGQETSPIFSLRVAVRSVGKLG